MKEFIHDNDDFSVPPARSVMPLLRVLRTKDGKLPEKAHRADQCFDFFSAEDVELRMGEVATVDLGCRVILPEGYGLRFFEKSGLALKGLDIKAGTIDNGYRGQLKAVVRWLHPDPFVIRRGDKVLQGELVKIIPTEIVEISREEFSEETDRGSDGFGSTGSN
jgi:dUTP pyrophosphatase